MFIEFQFSTQLFARMIRNRLRLLDLCFDAESNGLILDRVVPRSSSSATVVQRETRLDDTTSLRPEVPAATLNTWVFSPTNFYSFKTRHLQVVQELDIYLVRAADLETNGLAPTESYPLTVRVAFNVELRATKQTQGGGPAMLSYTFAWAHFGLADPFLPATQRKELEAIVSGATLAPTVLDLSPLSGLAGGTMRAINAGMALAADGKAVVLRVDVDVRETPPALSAAFFDAGAPNQLHGQEWAVVLDKDLLIQTMHDRIRDGLAGSGKARLKWGPQVSWEPAIPRLVARAGVEIPDACPFFIDDIDLDVDVEVAMGFAVPSPTTLALRFHIEAEAADIGEVIGCAVVPSLVWPFAGPLILDELESDSQVSDYFAGLLLGLPMICGIFASAVGTMAAQGISADTFGPHCTKHGDSDVECLYPLLINVGDSRFPIRLHGSQIHGSAAGLVLCGPAQVHEVPHEAISLSTSPLEWTIFGGCRTGFGFVVQAQIRVTSAGPRGGVCSARILDDPLGEFTVSVDRAEAMVTVRSHGRPAYQALTTKYPCKVRVITTNGVRTITYPPPAALTPERQQFLEQRRHNFTRVCQAWKDTFHEIEWGGWGPPGPIDGPDWLQHWEIAIHDLRPGEWVDVATDLGSEVLSARASAHGVVHFAAQFEGTGGPGALRLSRRGEGPFERAPVLTPVQMILVPRLTIPTRGDAVTMAFAGPDADRRLTIVDGSASRRFSLGSRAVNGLVEVSAEVHQDLEAQPQRRRRDAEPPRETMERIREVEAVAGETLAISEPRVGGVRRPLFVRGPRRAALYDLAGAQGPELVQLYADTAWFEHTALGGAWVARWHQRAKAVHLYHVLARRRDAEVPRRVRGEAGG